MLIARYPVKISQNSLIEELVPHDCISENCLFKQCDISTFKLAIEKKEHVDRVKKNKLRAFRKACEEALKELKNANTLIDVVLLCPCCGQTGTLNDKPIPQNFMISCNNCGCHWSKNKETIKWMKADSQKLYGLLEDFSSPTFHQKV